jgi:hypothetical protein
MVDMSAADRTGEDILEQADLLGSWQLVGVELTGEDSANGPPPFGGNPQGVLHYLADRRMAVIIQSADRPPIPGGRRGGSDGDWRRSARSFTAYSGTYTILPGRIVHHVEMNSFPNDQGVDYVRIAHVVNQCLWLETPPELPADQRPMRLLWKRFDGA